MVLAIDFDGTIHDHEHPKQWRSMGPPLPGAEDALNAFFLVGHKVIIHTVWPPERHKAIREWLNFYAIPFHSITNVKPKADLYIDDHALKFISWLQVLTDLYEQDPLPIRERLLGDPR